MKVDTKNGVAEVIDMKKRESAIAKHNRAFANFESGTWEYAKAVCEIVNSPSFKKAFANMGDFAAAVGRDKGTLSRLSRAYETRERFCKSEVPLLANYFGNASASAVQELIPLDDKSICQLIESGKVVLEDSAKDVRAVVTEKKHEQKKKTIGNGAKDNDKRVNEKRDVTIVVYMPSVSPDSDDLSFTTNLPSLTLSDIRAIEKLLKRRGYGDVTIDDGGACND